MTSFAKHIAVLAAAWIAATALAEKSSDSKGATPTPKESGGKKAKNSKNAKTTEEPAAPKKMDVPVTAGHDSKGLVIPYYDSTGRHEMEFHIGVASRVDDNHINMTNLVVDTFNEEGEHEMQIDLPTSVLDTDTSVITSHQHVTIQRNDFTLTGEAMIFNTKTKQGALGNNVHMWIYNLKEETDKADEGKDSAKPPKAISEPDTFKTPQPKETGGNAHPPDKSEKFLTPESK